jgi:hypothetical protein
MLRPASSGIFFIPLILCRLGDFKCRGLMTVAQSMPK